MFSKTPKYRAIPRVSLKNFFKYREANQAKTLLCLHQDYGGFIKLPLRGRFMVADPEIVQQVLLTNRDNYSKDLQDYRLLTHLMGSGLLTSEGKRWQAQRHVMQSLFHHREMRGYFESTIRAVDLFCEAWQEAPGQSVDITLEMMTLSLMMTAECLCKTSLSVATARQTVQHFFCQHEHVCKTGNLLSWIPLPRNIRYYFAKRFTDKVVYQIYRDHSQKQQRDVVGVMQQALNESTDKPFSEEDILDQVKTILATGHETTGLGLSWSWYLLAKNPVVQQRLWQEVQQAPLSELHYESLEQYSYSQSVFQEAIRLYPPIWAIPRYAKRADEVAGYKIPAKANVLLNIFSLHHLADQWHDPDMFNPDRFSKEHRDKRHKYAYLPFGAGPHVCIANALALMQAKIALIVLSSRFKLKLVNPELDPGLKTYVTLKPAQPILMKIEVR